MSTQSSGTAYTRWAHQIITSSVVNNKFHMHNYCNDASIDELKANLTKKLIEANTHVNHSRFDVAISQLYNAYYNKSNVKNPNYSKECWIQYPMEMWYVLFKAKHKIHLISKLKTYIRRLPIDERLNLIYTIYNIIPNQYKNIENLSQNNSKSNESNGFVIKNFNYNRLNIRKSRVTTNDIKKCIVKSTNNLNKDNKILPFNGLNQCKTSIWSFNTSLVKNVTIKTNLLIECLIFLCELARGFDDLPIISYDRILIDKIPVYKRSDSPLFRVIVTVAQYENFKINFCFADLNMAFLVSMKKISLKKLGRAKELRNLKLLEEYKQCFNAKQNYVHDETNPLLSCVYLFKESNFSHLYNTYNIYSTNNEMYQSRFSIIRYLKNIRKCCLSQQNQEDFDSDDDLSVSSLRGHVNLTNVYSDIMYTLDLLFEQSQSTVHFPNALSPQIKTILDWIFLLALATIYDSTLLYNIITRLTLFGMKLAPFDKDGVFTKFTSDSLKFGYNPSDLDICNLDNRLLLIHNLLNSSHDFSNLEFIFTNLNTLSDSDTNVADTNIATTNNTLTNITATNIKTPINGAKMKCLERVMKFVLCNLKVGHQIYMADYEKVKGIVDSEINSGNLVGLDLLLSLSLSELIIGRFDLSLNYVKLALSLNELDKNSWRIVFTLIRNKRKKTINHFTKTFSKRIKVRIIKDNLVRFNKRKPIIAFNQKFLTKASNVKPATNEKKAFDEKNLTSGTASNEKKTTNSISTNSVNIRDLPVEILSIIFMKPFKLALNLEKRILETHWWFPWEAHIAKLVNADNEVKNDQYDFVISRRGSNLSNRDMNNEGLDVLLQNLLKNDINGINNTLWVLSDIEFPLYKNENFYELFVALWVLCHIGYAKTVIDLIGLNTFNDPDSSYLSIYAQLCLTTNTYENDLINRVKNLGKKYQGFHRLTRLQARLNLAIGEFGRARQLFSKARNGYFVGYKMNNFNGNLISMLVNNICGNHSPTSTDTLCENYCNKCIKDESLYF